MEDDPYRELRKQLDQNYDPDFGAVPFNEIQPVLDTGDFVQGLLTRQSLVVVYGQSTSGKTFWTTTLALHVAAGMEFAGRRVEQGAVVYCCMEGSFGFRNRVHAWRSEHGLDDYNLPFWAITNHVNMLDHESVVAFIEFVKKTVGHQDLPLRLIVFDTLARALSGGNENHPDDMGQLVMMADKIRAETGACVLFIHHSGKNQALGARGHSSLQAAIDTEIEVTDNNGERRADVVKQRDLAKGTAFPFSLKVIELGVNPYSEPVTTCLVEFADPANSPKPAKPPKLTEAAKLCLRALDNALGKNGAKLPPTSEFPPDTWGVAISQWRSEVYDLAGADPDANRQTFHRGQKALVAGNIITQHDLYVWKVHRDRP
jgi:hypothetical protein